MEYSDKKGFGSMLSAKAAYRYTVLAVILIISQITLNARPPFLEDREKERLESILENNPENIDCLAELCSFYTMTGNYGKAMIYADRMTAVADGETDSFRKLKVLAYSSQAYLAADMYETAYAMLSEGLELWEKLHDDESDIVTEKEKEDGADMVSIAMLYNSMGVYSVSYELDYEKATVFFTRGLEFARDNGMTKDYSIISYNLIMSFFIRGKSEGLKYAEELYMTGHRMKDERMIYMGAYESAMMHYLNRNYRKAEEYIKEALASPIKLDDVWVHNTYANILAGLGRESEAYREYETALHATGRESSTSAMYVHYSYGNFLISQGKPEDAIRILDEGVEIAEKYGNKVFIYQLYRSLSEAYAMKRDYLSALEFYRRYHQLSDSIFNIKKERAINELEIKFRTATHEAEIKEKDLELMKKNHALELSLFITLLVIISLIITYLRYRSQNAMYTKIARQYQEARKNEKHLKDLLLKYSEAEKTKAAAEIHDETTEPTVHAVSDKTSEIAEKLEFLMEEKGIYKDNTLSRDRLAEMIGTNRTYLSKIINDRYGKSVNQYINSYRIKKAVELLSIQDTNLPMKAIEAESGFSSSSTFFKTFKDEVGMSPAKFREKILEISKENPAYGNSDSPVSSI